MLLQAAGSDAGSGSQGCEWGFVLATAELPPCLAGSSMVGLGKGSGTTSRGRLAKDGASTISHNVYYVRLRLTGLRLRRPALFVETQNLGRMHLSRLAPTCLHLPGTSLPASSRLPKCPFAIEPRPIRQQA